MQCLLDSVVKWAVKKINGKEEKIKNLTGKKKKAPVKIDFMVECHHKN